MVHSTIDKCVKQRASEKENSAKNVHFQIERHVTIKFYRNDRDAKQYKQ